MDDTPPCRHRPGPAPAAPLVLFPGFLETRAAWQPLLDRHPDLDRPVRILPLPGHDPEGRAPAIQRLEGNRFIDDYAERLADAFPGQRLRLVGHSTGGLVALELARRHPQMVGAILLAGPICSGRLNRFGSPGVRLLAAERSGPLLAWGLHRASVSSARLFTHICRTSEAARSPSPGMPDGMRRELAACPSGALRAVLLWLTRQCLLDRLPDIRTPVLGIIGRRDPVVPPEHQIALMHRLPRGLAQLVPTGHLPFLEAPEIFDRSFRRWLRHEAAPGKAA